jgi:hypothetical protein
MIPYTLPEPRLDVAAQIAALLSPEHPKDAVWLAAGTPAPVVDVPRVVVVAHEAGTLFTTDPDKARRFEAAPDDDTLAEVLGYVEPKSAVVGDPVVVQARTADGAVVLEMVCSPAAVDPGIARARGHGAVFLISVPEALARRVSLWTRGL